MFVSVNIAAQQDELGEIKSYTEYADLLKTAWGLAEEDSVLIAISVSQPPPEFHSE